MMCCVDTVHYIFKAVFVWTVPKLRGGVPGLQTRRSCGLLELQHLLYSSGSELLLVGWLPAYVVNASCQLIPPRRPMSTTSSISVFSWTPWQILLVLSKMWGLFCPRRSITSVGFYFCCLAPWSTSSSRSIFFWILLAVCSWSSYLQLVAAVVTTNSTHDRLRSSYCVPSSYSCLLERPVDLAMGPILDDVAEKIWYRWSTKWPNPRPLPPSSCGFWKFFVRNLSRWLWGNLTSVKQWPPNPHHLPPVFLRILEKYSSSCWSCLAAFRWMLPIFLLTGALGH